MQLYSFQYFADSFACRFRFCFMQYSQIGIYILSGRKGIRKSLSRQGGNFLRREKKRERLQSKTFPWFLDGIVFF